MAVHHVALCYIADYSNSTAAADSLGTTTFVGVDNLISDKGGRRDATHGPNTSTVTGFDTGDVLIGNIRPYLKKVWLADRAGGCSGDVLAVRIRPEYRGGLDPSFLYYLLSSDQFFAFNTQHAKGAKMPRGDKRAILTYRIPLPPLEIQRNIVEVLDTFRSLEAKLEAELEARRRQYLHYRDNLLAPQPDALRTRLGDVALIGTGSHDTKDAIPDGDHVFYARGRDPLRLDSFDFDEQAIITAGDGVGVGKVFHFADGKYALHQRAYRIVPSAKLHPRYLYHVLLADFGRYLVTCP